MTDDTYVSGTLTGAAASSSATVRHAQIGSKGSDREPDRLEGHLGTAGLIFTALAMNAPLAIMATWMPFIIGNGLGTATPLTFLVLMVFVLLFAVGLVAMSKHMEKPGAFYSYITAGLGRVPGLGAGFIALLLYVCFAASSYLIFGALVDGQVLAWGGPHIPWYVYSGVVFLAVTFISIRNIDVSARVLMVTLFIEVLIVVIYDLSIFARGGPEGRAVGMFDDLGLASVGFGLLWGVTCLTGFESIQVFRQETRNPNKTIPRATYLTVIFLAGFYALGAYAYIVGLGPSAAIASAADPSQGFLTSLAHYSGHLVRDVALVMLLTSFVAAFLALQNIGARYIFAMARDGVLPASLSGVHPRWKSPMRAAAAMALTILVIDVTTVSLGADPIVAFGMIGGMANWAVVTLFTVTAISIVVFFRRRTDATVGPWRGMIAPCLAALGFIYILGQATVNRDALFGTMTKGTIFIGVVLAVAVGGGIYAAWLRVHKPAVFERIGDQQDESFD